MASRLTTKQKTHGLKVNKKPVAPRHKYCREFFSLLEVSTILGKLYYSLSIQFHSTRLLLCCETASSGLRRRNDSLDSIHPNGLQERCDQLHEVLETMVVCLEDLALLVQQFKALIELERLQQQESTVNVPWSTSKFGQAYQDIFHKFSAELSLKKTIKEDVAHCSSKGNLLFHILSWTSEPFIDHSTRLLCESIFVAAALY